MPTLLTKDFHDVTNAQADDNAELSVIGAGLGRTSTASLYVPFNIHNCR